MDNKRKRSANWLQSEKDLLVSIIEQHSSIIENKKTDGVTMKSKAAQWQIIADQYNSRATHCFRTAEVLKAQWESLKKWTRKEVANLRKNMIQTGGGPPPPNKDDPLLNRILSIIVTSAKGLFNEYDSDSVVPSTSATAETDPFNQEAAEKWKTDENLEPTLIIIEGTQDITFEKEHNNIKEKNDVQDALPAGNNDWGDYTPQLLQTPKSQVLLQNKNTVKATEKQTWPTRRRPLYNKVTSSLEQLHKKKIEAIDLQLALAMEENEKAKIQHDLDVKIKNEKLKQEQIRTRLMLIRQRKLLVARRKHNTTNK